MEKKPSAAKKVPRDGKQNGKKLSEKVCAARIKKEPPESQSSDRDGSKQSVSLLFLNFPLRSVALFPSLGEFFFVPWCEKWRELRTKHSDTLALALSGGEVLPFSLSLSLRCQQSRAVQLHQLMAAIIN